MSLFSDWVSNHSFGEIMTGIGRNIANGWNGLKYIFGNSDSEQIPVQSPATASDTTSQESVPVDPIPVSAPQTSTANPGLTDYMSNNSYDDYLAMLQKGAQIGLFSTAEDAVNEAQKDRLFQSLEADKTRKWYEEMSDTSYQRQVADLEAAGLNPMLAYMKSSAGAVSAMPSTPQGRSTNISSNAPSLSDYMNAGANLISAAGDIVKAVGQITKVTSFIR